MKTAHEVILSYMKLTQNHGQVGYPMLAEAMDLGWYKLFKKTKESFVSKWVYVKNGIAQMPPTAEILHGVFVFNYCGDLIPLYEDNIKNILPPLATQCSCNSCDTQECLCPEINRDNVSIVDVVIEGVPYQNKYFTRVLKNGNVIEEKHEWIPSYNQAGTFVDAVEVQSQITKCKVDVKPCGCPIKSEGNSKKLLSHGCIQHRCAPVLRKQYPALYNDIGYYKVDEITKQIHLFDSKGDKSELTQVMLSYQSNGKDMLVPEYAYLPLIALLDWTKKQFSPMFRPQDALFAKKYYLRQEKDMLKHLNPIPYQFASEVSDPFAKSYYGGAHSDFINKTLPAPATTCTASSGSSASNGGTIVNNFYSTGGGGGTESYLKRIVDGPDADSPVGGTNTYQNNLLKDLGNNNADRVEIVVAGIEMYNWGDNKTFDLNKITGTITFTVESGYTWQTGTSLKVNLGQ